MAAAAALELNRSVGSSAGLGVGTDGAGIVDREAGPFLLSVCVCGLLEAEEG